ncbi:nuclear transport factor 2 family protein [uncultured Ruegeria sp.]|uniref:nuclear transport factor 2 family protein n=1 Tax=uncultured Ruegeria sp. TaxID=259304 RepID=UPI002606CA26|nr:nuclear transport factor 2 family protein [uncultured Ruegeria sp.]
MIELNQIIADYGAAWQEHSDGKRLELLKRCFSETGQYIDPTAQVSGRDQLCTHIGEVLQNSNGRVDITSEPSSHHDVVHFTWHMVAPDGSVMVSGHDFIRRDDEGQIAHLAGFFGDPTPMK